MPDPKVIQNSRAVSILRSLSKYELKTFSRFLKENGSDSVYVLFNFIRQFAPDFDHPDLTSERAFKKVFPKTKFDQNKVVRRLNSLLSQLEIFVTSVIQTREIIDPETPKSEQKILDLEKNITDKISLLKFYNARGIEGRFDKILDQLNDLLESYPLQNAFYYESRFKAEFESSNFNSKYREKGLGDLNFQNTSDAFDEYYLFSKLKLICLLQNRQNTLKLEQPYDLGIAPQILEKISDSSNSKSESINTWHHAFLFLLNQDNYREFKQQLISHIDLFEKKDARILFTFLENAINKHVADQKERLEGLFELYQLQLEKGIIQETGSLSPFTFQNIVTVALKLSMVDWTSNFIEENINKVLSLTEPELNNLHLYNKALLAFEAGRFEAVPGLLNDLKLTNWAFKIGRYRTLIKAHYEMRTIDESNCIWRFRKYLFDNKDAIHERIIDLHRQFNNLAEKIYNTTPGDKSRFEKLKNEIMANNIPEQEWLLEKADKR